MTDSNTVHQSIIQQTVEHVKTVLENAEGGHDWWHIQRVWNTAQQIASEERVEPLVVELGALLHDIADSKFHNGDESIGPKLAGEFLTSIHVEEATVRHVQLIIQHISFKGGNHAQTFRSKELDIVQDADRLDAMGAIGIARAFSYGGYKKMPFYIPGVEPRLNKTKEEYKNAVDPTINHFYEKLFLLKDRMNTAAGKRLAQQRHQFMEQYVQQFMNEWNATIR